MVTKAEETFRKCQQKINENTEGIGEKLNKTNENEKSN